MNKFEVQLYDTDYVLLNNGEPLEPLDVIYSKESINELLQGDFALKESEQFIVMTDLPDNLKIRYCEFLKGVN